MYKLVILNAIHFSCLEILIRLIMSLIFVLTKKRLHKSQLCQLGISVLTAATLQNFVTVDIFMLGVNAIHFKTVFSASRFINGTL